MGHRILYIPRKIDDWVLLLEFQTNSPGTTTFDPTILASSGEYKWDVGGVEVLGTSVSLTLDGTNQTVKLYGKGSCNVTSTNFRNDHIVGSLNLSNDAFKPLKSVILHTNMELTSVQFPIESTEIITTIQIYSTNITGTLDISMFSNFSNATIQLWSNSLLTSVTFASSTTGQVSIWAPNCDLTGVLDLSMFTNCKLYSFYNNPNLTGITMPATNTATVTAIDVRSCDLTGTLDLRGITSYGTSTIIRFRTNPNLTAALFNSSLTGSLVELYGNDCNVSYSDYRGISSLTSKNNAAIYIQNNLMTTTEVNHILVDLDTNSVSGYTGRSISIGGTNAAPDTTSGGYDGLAAKASLEAKGFTVHTT